jgi:hypothetical protein
MSRHQLRVPRPEYLQRSEIDINYAHMNQRFDRGVCGMTVTLGRLLSVPLREVWQHEANDFTPWLAKPENIALLAETLSVGELQVEGIEVPVGDFSIDILARDLNGDIVVIENQFGSTDHRHLGQIMTYVAGQESKATVVWIAETFREEHRAAIDWLNASTIEGFNFFAIEVEALRIGSSVPAPRFNVVGKPNEWSRASRQIGASALNETTRLYLEYWTVFRDYLTTKDPKYRPPEPRPSHAFRFATLRPGFSLNAVVSRTEKRMRVEIYMSAGGETPKLALRALRKDKEAIEQELGTLHWDEEPDRQATRIFASQRGVDFESRALWPEQHRWLFEQSEIIPTRV